MFDNQASIPMTSTWFASVGMSAYSLLGLYDDAAATPTNTDIDHEVMHDRAA